MERLEAQIDCRIQELKHFKHKLMQLQKVQNIDKVLESGMCCVSVSRVREDSMVEQPIDITAMMNEQEIAVLLKAVQVTLSFTQQRLEREINEINSYC